MHSSLPAACEFRPGDTDRQKNMEMPASPPHCCPRGALSAGFFPSVFLRVPEGCSLCAFRGSCIQWESQDGQCSFILRTQTSAVLFLITHNLWEPVAAMCVVDLSISWHRNDPGSQLHLNRESHFLLDNTLSFHCDFNFSGHTCIPQQNSTFYVLS